MKALKMESTLPTDLTFLGYTLVSLTSSWPRNFKSAKPRIPALSLNSRLRGTSFLGMCRSYTLQRMLSDPRPGAQRQRYVAGW